MISTRRFPRRICRNIRSCRAFGVDPDKFWGLCRDFAEEHQMDGVLTYMYLMKKMAQGELDLSREKLNELGRDVAFFPGVESWFDRINRIGEASGVQVEHYIISSGLTDIIRGSAIGNQFKAVFAASFCYDARRAAPIWPAIGGQLHVQDAVPLPHQQGHPRRYERPRPERATRRNTCAGLAPFSNMIYVGDGLTDVPCMKMTKQKGGYSIAVHAPGRDRNAADDLLLQGRADFAMRGRLLRGNSELEQVVTLLMRRILATSDLSYYHARQIQKAHARRGEQTPAEHPPPRRSDRRSAGIKAFHPPKRFLCGGYLLAHRLSITAQFAFSCRLAHRAIHSTAFSRKYSFQDKSNRRRTISAAVKKFNIQSPFRASPSSTGIGQALFRFLDCAGALGFIGVRQNQAADIRFRRDAGGFNRAGMAAGGIRNRRNGACTERRFSARAHPHSQRICRIRGDISCRP